MAESFDVELVDICIDNELLMFETPLAVTVNKHGAVYYVECDDLFLLSISKEREHGLERLKRSIYDLYYGRYEDDAPASIQDARRKFLQTVIRGS